LVRLPAQSRIFSVALDNAEHTGRFLKTLRNRPFLIFQLGIISGQKFGLCAPSRKTLVILAFPLESLTQDVIFISLTPDTQ
jgi:hypothetical protein